MGGPKALLERGGLTLLALHVERALQLGAAHVAAIVTPEVAQRVAPVLSARWGKLSLVSARPDSQSASLAILLRQLARLTRFDDRTFLITPVDVLPCSEGTYRALHGALDPATLAATPSHEGRGGHPVLVRSELLAPYLEGSVESRPILRDLLRRVGSRRKRVEVADGNVLCDLDTREQAEVYDVKLPW